MTPRRQLAAGLTLLVIMNGCRVQARPIVASSRPDSTLLAERTAALQARIAHPDSAKPDAPIARWNLPSSLSEISGLGLTGDGRLLTHGDSRGKIVELDYRRGVVLKEFLVGAPPAHGDFEAITLVGDMLVLLASDGVLYLFAEGANATSVPFTTYDTGLGERCEFEGLAYESTVKTLLLACKKVHVKALRDSLIVYRVPIEMVTTAGKGGGKKLSYLAVPLSRIIGSNEWTTLHPSDITIDPFNGNYVFVASMEKALFELTPAGALVFARSLPPGHDQAEGVAITKDSILIISDEAKVGPALLTLYRWRQ